MGGANHNLLEDIRNTKKNIQGSHSSLSSDYSTLVSLAEQLENRCKELQEKEIELSSKEAKWKETENVIEHSPNVIRMDVSGTKFSITKEKLLQHKGSLFEQIIANSHSQTPSGEIFIERDPSYFKFIIRFLLNGTLVPPSNAHKHQAIEQEFDFFKIPFKFNIPIFLPRGPSGDLISNTKYEDSIRQWLPNKKFQLLYKASIDGFGEADFHKHCDNKGATLTLIRSTSSYLFGGFTPFAWDASSTYKTHPDMFVFTLSNPHNIPPTKYALKNPDKYGIYCYSPYGPIFGGGHDILVADNSDSNNSSYTNFPYSYIDTTRKGNATFTGNRKFTTSEIEVFAVL